jgi:hypothetical protein
MSDLSPDQTYGAPPPAPDPDAGRDTDPDHDQPAYDPVTGEPISQPDQPEEPEEPEE